MKEYKHYEVSMSMSYEAKNPVDAAQTFIDNVAIAEWYVTVKNVDTGEVYNVDTETWEVEEE